MDKNNFYLNNINLMNDEDNAIDWIRKSSKKTLEHTQEQLKHFQKYDGNGEDWNEFFPSILSFQLTIEEYDKKFLEKVNEIFNDKNNSPIIKFKVFSDLIMILNERKEILFIIENEKYFKANISHNICIKILATKKLVEQFLNDLKSKKDNLDLPGLIYEKHIDEKLITLVANTDQQFTILKNINLSNDQRVNEFIHLGNNSRMIDQEIHIAIMDNLTPKAYSENILKDIDEFFKKMSNHYQSRIDKINKMFNFVNDSPIFGINDSTTLKKRMTSNISFLQDNQKKLEGRFTEIKEKIAQLKKEKEEEERKRKEKEKKEREEREKEEQRKKEEKELEKNKAVVTKVIKAFNLRQKFPVGKKIVYENGDIWKINDIISKANLEIVEPDIPETQLVKITYRIVAISITEYERYVIVEATVQYNNFSDKIRVWMLDFTTEDMIDQNNVDAYIKKFKREYTTSKVDYYTFEFIVGQNYSEYDLGIDEPAQNFSPEIEYQVLSNEVQKGVLSVNVKVIKNNYSSSKIITISGFKKAYINNINFYLNQFDSENEFDLKYQMSTYSTWNDVIGKIKEGMIHAHIDDKFVNALKWINWGKGKNLKSRIYEDDFPTSQIYKKIRVFINSVPIGIYRIYFKNLKEKDKIVQNWTENNHIKVEIGPTDDEKSVTKDFIILPHLKSLGGWKYLTSAYKKIHFKNLDLYIDRKGEDIKTKIDKEVEIDWQNISLGYKINLWSSGYELPVALQKARIDVVLLMNDEGHLVAQFTVWGKVKWQVRGQTISLYVKEIIIE